MQRAGSLGLAIWIGVVSGCGDKSPEPATREDCTKVAEHIAELIIRDAASQPEALYDAIRAAPGESAIPADVTRDGFKAWLETPAGQTFLMQRKGQTLSGTQVGIDACVKDGTKALTRCLLAATKKEDVEACDRKHGKRIDRPAPPSPGRGAAGTGG